jgi:hypothetical protein
MKGLKQRFREFYLWNLRIKIGGHAQCRMNNGLEKKLLEFRQGDRNKFDSGFIRTQLCEEV